ncbi:SCP-like protein [Necator americanus]|uniref:SCP-like protein n=1 Tax=Necator americanus TaxID=51031 RepID=W2SH90_NECAM|nr:SCP-like protein [Necator americanus]ETN68241.1 SCP-like protein [Necator americanus]
MYLCFKRGKEDLLSKRAKLTKAFLKSGFTACRPPAVNTCCSYHFCSTLSMSLPETHFTVCDGPQFAAFTNDERQALLDAHNNLRKNIADGKQDSKDGKLPSAKNMYQLKYICGMEKILQAELDKCTGSATLTSQYGQNILTSLTLNARPKDELIKAAIEIWTGPLKYYGLKNITNYDDDRLYTFANMAYAKTLRFGCAYKQCHNAPQQEAHISCIYNLV